MIKVTLVLGTRPEAIKLAPLVHRLRRNGIFRCNVVATGQHADLLDQTLDAVQLVPDIRLTVLNPGQSMAALGGKLLTQLDPVLADEKPDVVLVQGDTTTAMSAATAAFLRQIPVGHVEAGLRTGDLASPMPEEFNRRVITLASALHFAPTLRAAQCLESEGVDPSCVFMTGNTGIDALFDVLARPQTLTGQDAKLEGFIANHPSFVLVTLHRRESLADGGILQVCRAVEQLARRHPGLGFIIPVHPNPTVGVQLSTLGQAGANVLLCAPLAYDRFVRLLAACRFVITDSGGLQEEGPTLGKPLVVARNITERMEANQLGGVFLTGPNATRIVEVATILIEDQAAYARACNPIQAFGDGKASERIMAALVRHFQKAELATVTQ